MAQSNASTSSSPPITRASKLPFEQLPNLPKPVIPKIDLAIQREDISALLQLQPSLASQRKVGYFIEDRSTQTDVTQILDVKHAVLMLQTLTQDIGQLRRDLNFSQHALKINHETQLQQRAAELYCHANDRLNNLEQQHKTRVDVVRKSYQTQLEDAIQVISGEYKAYYDELMQGKTGRIDLKLKELKQQLALKNNQLEEQLALTQELTDKIKELEGGAAGQEEVPPPPPPGISLEEAEELEQRISELQEESEKLRNELSAAEDSNEKLTRQISLLNRQLEDEKSKYAQLQRDTESFKRKAKLEQEKAAKMAENQLAAMQKEMKQKMKDAEREATKKAQEQAELERMRDQAKFQEEMIRRKNLEDDLRSQAQTKAPTVVGDAELLNKLERLEKANEEQTKEIARLTKAMDKLNRIWELKMAVMKKNFHSLKDEFFIRQTLQRQSAALHHATVGYAVSGDMAPESASTRQQHHNRHYLKPLHLNQSSSLSSTRQKTSRDSIMSSVSIPPPSPNFITHERVPTPKNVRFEEDDQLLIDVTGSRPETVNA